MKKSIAILISLIACAWGFAQEQVTNLPTIYINTENYQGVYSKEDYVNCTVTVASGDEAEAISGKEAGIRGRGNSTWNMAKKPYRIKFDKKLNFMGQNAKAKSWVLLANYADKTLMRNAVAFEISRFVGFDFSPSAVFADVVLNGQYLGNYMVSDQMQVGKGRVDIDEMDETCTSGEELTGGYFLEIDGFGEGEPYHFKTNRGLIITIKSPDEDVIQSVQVNYIKNFVNKFETALFSSNFADPDEGFAKYLDIKSFVDWYICCELTGNSDSFWSTYIYKKRSDDHLYFGPLWDFDIAFNNDNRLGDATQKLMRDSAHDPKTWIQRMWQAEWFRQAVYDRWYELRAQGLEQFILDFIDDTAQYIDQSQRKNFEKWNVLGQRVYLEQYLFNTYQGGVDYLKEYVQKRIAFLDMSFRGTGAVTEIDNIANETEYYIVHYVSLYATAEKDNFYIKNPQDNYQRLAFVQTATPGVWNIRTSDGRLVASQNGNKYCSYTTDGTDSHAQFAIEPSAHAGYAKIRNLATGKYLGVEHTAHNSRISTDKDGTSTNHAWKILSADFSGVQSIATSAPMAKFDAACCALVSDIDAEWEIYTIDGRRVLTAKGPFVSIAHLSPGIYIARTPYSTIKFIR